MALRTDVFHNISITIQISQKHMTMVDFLIKHTQLFPTAFIFERLICSGSKNLLDDAGGWASILGIRIPQWCQFKSQVLQVMCLGTQREMTKVLLPLHPHGRLRTVELLGSWLLIHLALATVAIGGVNKGMEDISVCLPLSLQVCLSNNFN